MKLLISGIPGTGKSFIGDYLVEKHGFKHFNLEDDPDTGRIIWGLLCQGKTEEILFMLKNEQKVVLTVGYPPEFYGRIKKMADAGFTLAWFDAPILFSRKNWKPNPGQPLETYNNQLNKIINHHAELLKLYGKNRICVCDEHGQAFRPAKELAATLMKLAQS